METYKAETVQTLQAKIFVHQNWQRQSALDTPSLSKHVPSAKIARILFFKECWGTNIKQRKLSPGKLKEVTAEVPPHYCGGLHQVSHLLQERLPGSFRDDAPDLGCHGSRIAPNLARSLTHP